MSRRIASLVLSLLFVSTLALAAEPAKVAAPQIAAAATAAPALPWLAPATPALDRTPARTAGEGPLGAVLQRACNPSCQACQARCAANGGDSCCYWRCDRVGPNPC